MPIAQIISIALSVLDLAERVGVNIAQLNQARATAKSEGRDLTDEEVQTFASEAQSAIDRARNA